MRIDEHDTDNTLSARVDPAWVDIYGHMNMAYYVHLFDALGHRILARYGLGEEYTRRTGYGLFTVSAKIAYLKEVRAHDELTISLRIDRADDKRVWTSLEMRHSLHDFVAANMDQLAVNVSLETRRAIVFPADIQAALAPFRSDS